MARRAITSALKRLRRGDMPAEAPAPDPVLATLEAFEREVIERSLPHSLTSRPRVLALIDAVRYCQARGVPGAFAECGVWRGGSVVAMILTLQELGIDDRDIYLYDTFEGMPEPTALDTSRLESPALDTWNEASTSGDKAWPHFFNDEIFSEQIVRDNVLSTGYPEERVRFVRGKVEETVPGVAPDQIALLRLDTDWYESTRHELIHLYPRLVPGGVLIIDDYGHWEGARRAVDEYFAEQAEPILLSRIDYTARIGVKR
jgi:O-methyltransferase